MFFWVGDPSLTQVERLVLTVFINRPIMHISSLDYLIHEFGNRRTSFAFDMKSSYFLLLASCILGTLAQTDAKKLVPVDDGRIVMHQVCNSGTDDAEISSLKKEVETLKERMDKDEAKGKKAICTFS